MAGFRHRLVCGTFFSYGPRLVRGTVFFWCVVRYAFCMVLYGQVNRGCCYWVYKVCGHTDRPICRYLKKRDVVVWYIRDVDRQTQADSFYKLRISDIHNQRARRITQLANLSTTHPCDRSNSQLTYTRYVLFFQQFLHWYKVGRESTNKERAAIFP